MFRALAPDLGRAAGRGEGCGKAQKADVSLHGWTYPDELVRASPARGPTQLSALVPLADAPTVPLAVSLRRRFAPSAWLLRGLPLSLSFRLRKRKNDQLSVHSYVNSTGIPYWLSCKHTFFLPSRALLSARVDRELAIRGDHADRQEQANLRKAGLEKHRFL